MNELRNCRGCYYLDWCQEEEPCVSCCGWLGVSPHSDPQPGDNGYFWHDKNSPPPDSPLALQVRIPGDPPPLFTNWEVHR